MTGSAQGRRVVRLLASRVDDDAPGLTVFSLSLDLSRRYVSLRLSDRTGYSLQTSLPASLTWKIHGFLVV